ncbi:MAG: hypothetical protein IPO90_16260 [Flavobacteriales bacterium]|nr:hypothetical protein [Flavobacteriales bacterium]
MKRILSWCSWMVLSMAILWSALAHAQGTWFATNIPNSGRYDDVFFLGPDTGWAVGGSAGTIYKTTNGGGSWILQYNAPEYLRSIEFANDTLGFAGSLDHALYKTTNGGGTWTDISTTIQPQPTGICGLSIPNAQTIYGCGIWSSPAYIIRSNDAGNTWIYSDMSAYALALVDIHFLTPDTGFVTGTSINPAEGGIVLRTTNGGASWQTVHTTGVTSDIIWKIQVLDASHCFGSVYGVGLALDTRMIRSSDGGLTWEGREVADHYTYAEGMGFIDPLHGWVGGDAELFSTSDGGDTWVSTVMGALHNRFFRVNENTAYLSGQSIYKFSSDPNSIAPLSVPSQQHQLSASLSPDGGTLNISVDLLRTTIAVLEIRASDGRLIDRPLFDRHASGAYHFSVKDFRSGPGVVLVILSTNEGLISERVIVTR